MPEPNEGFVPVLNGMGFMTSTLDPFSEAFVDFCAKTPLKEPALEIGAAYGVATLEVLRAKKPIVANDLDPRHLAIIQERAKTQKLGTFEPNSDRFPNQTSFGANAFCAILICRVLHFLDVNDLRDGMKKLFSWLAPGGKVFIVCETPYLFRFKKFIPVYEERKRRGDPWPGRIENAFEYTDHAFTDIPQFLHWMDDEVLSRLLREAGFVVERAEMIARPDYPSWVKLDGRESVGVIGRKP